MARVVDTLLPGVVGFCAPVFDSDRRMVMGIVSLGSAATFDAEWGGTVETPLRAMARQLIESAIDILPGETKFRAFLEQI